MDTQYLEKLILAKDNWRAKAKKSTINLFIKEYQSRAENAHKSTQKMASNQLLQMACTCGKIEIVEFLISQGADVNLVIVNINLLWHQLLQEPINEPLCKTLINAGADMHYEATGDGGKTYWTMLAYCVYLNRNKSVKLLVSCDVNVEQKFENSMGTTAMEVACFFNKIEIKEFLEIHNQKKILEGATGLLKNEKQTKTVRKI